MSLSEKLVAIYESGEQSSTELNIQENELTVILFVGVNGVGKDNNNWEISLINLKMKVKRC